MGDGKGLGIIGYGMGAHHAKLIRAVPGVRVHAVCDLKPEMRAKAEAENPGVRTYGELDQLLADPGVECVIVVTPHNTHADLAIRAMRAGKHVVTDKAMCLSMAEARAMIAARDEAGRLLTVFHNRRWDRDFVTVTRLIDEFTLGRMYHMESCVTDYSLIGGWRSERTAMGGWLYDWGAHTIDQILLLAKDTPKHVYAFWHYRYDKPSTVEDYIELTITFNGGMTARTVVGYINRLPMPRWYVMGEYGALRSEGFEKPIQVRKQQGEGHVAYDVALDAADWTAFYVNLREALEGRAPLAVTPEQVLPQTAIADAAYRSIETEQVVRVVV